MDPTPRHGLVQKLLIADAAGEAMATPERVTLISGVGIEGDRYATKSGHWSDPRWPDQEITLIEGEVLTRLGIEATQVRRNIVTSGLPLRTLIGKEFSVGETRLVGVRVCDPCRYIEQFSRSGLMDELGDDGGLRARILVGGIVRLNDLVAAIAEPAFTERGRRA